MSLRPFPVRRFAVLALAPLLLAAKSAGAAPVKPAPKAGDALPVPAKALVVAQVRGVGAAKDRLNALVKAAAPDLAPLVAGQIDKAMATAVEGRDLSTLTPDGRVFLALMSFEKTGDGQPAALVLPVADLDAFKKLLTADERKSFEKGKGGVSQFESQGRPLFVADLGTGYVAVGPSKEVVEPFAGKFEPMTSADMGAGVGEAFLAADASMFVNMDKINDDYGDKIRQFRQLMQVFLQQAAAAGGAPGLDKAQLDMVKDLYDGLFQAAEDSEGFALGFDFPPGGVAVRVDAAFGTDTVTGKAFAKETAGPQPGLGDLPAGQMAYSGGQLSAKLAGVMARLSPEFTAEDDDEKTAALVTKYLELAGDTQGRASLAAGTMPNTALLVATPADPAAVVAAKLKVLKALPAGAKYANVILKEKPAVKEAAAAVGGITLHEARLVLDFDATVKNLADANQKEIQIASMKRFVNEKPNLWFGTDGKRVVQVAAKDLPAAEKLLGDYLAGRNTVGDNPAFKAGRGQLPAGVSSVVLADVGQVIAAAAEMFASIGDSVPGLPIGKLPKLTPTKDVTAYLGAAVVLKPGAARFDFFVPADAVKVGRAMIAPAAQK